ncbi:methyltransferase domain-containing protein [Nocardia mexicana]|uniref:Methyltransferase family protein n=1 Tax=Nocardia mexicana TaxID=279262 RepID=A0A370GGY6_9NOCA|nr:methyltransferase domain-containing protein [Nocardia mexicana]RDI42506.1 methyltransferase family protein [Nocardia mexicana]
MTGPSESYIIRGGTAGRERLRVIASVLEPTTRALLERLPVRAGDRCWDVGSGGGDVTLLLADFAGPAGWALGTDIDPVKVELAGQEAHAYANVEYRTADVLRETPSESFDLAHARFLLSHLTDPGRALAAIVGSVRPGGVVAVEDVDFSAPLCHPDVPAFIRYHDLYIRTAQQRRADPLIGPRLPHLLRQAGLSDIHAFVHQPAGLDPASKLVSVLTVENIADAALEADLTTPDELSQLLADLRATVDNPKVLIGLPRMVQAWGRAPD